MEIKNLIMTLNRFSEYQFQGLLMDSAGKTVTDIIGGSAKEVTEKAEAYCRENLNTTKTKYKILDSSSQEASALLVKAAREAQKKTKSE